MGDAKDEIWGELVPIQFDDQRWNVGKDDLLAAIDRAICGEMCILNYSGKPQTVRAKVGKGKLVVWSPTGKRYTVSQKGKLKEGREKVAAGKPMLLGKRTAVLDSPGYCVELDADELRRRGY
jgi:hypothetical protein